MSIKVMARVWESGPESQGERFVLLALADRADDRNECWPSIASIAERCCMTDRGVRKIIRRLEAGGWLDVRVGSGRHGCSVYRINTEPRSGYEGQKTRNDVPPEPRSPRNLSAETRNESAQNPEPRSPEPSGTTKNHHSSSSSVREDEVPDEDPFVPQPGDDPPPDVAADDQLYDQVVAAVGLTGGHLPTHWLPPAASIHVGKWRSQLGLTATEIIATARESRKRHDDPPRGPKALDRAMEATASAKSTSFSASGGARPRSPAQGQRKPHWQVMAERDEREQARRHA